jgi:hypothetical protein
MDVLVRVNGGCGGHDGYCCNGVWCFGIRVVALEETVLWAVGAMEQVVVRKICCYGSLSLWMDVTQNSEVKHLSKFTRSVIESSK